MGQRERAASCRGEDRALCIFFFFLLLGCLLPFLPGKSTFPYRETLTGRILWLLFAQTKNMRREGKECEQNTNFIPKHVYKRISDE